MGSYCPGCGINHDEDDGRLCADCRKISSIMLITEQLAMDLLLEAAREVVAKGYIMDGESCPDGRALVEKFRTAIAMGESLIPPPPAENGQRRTAK